MSLLDGGISSLFSSVLGSLFLDATLHRKNPGDADDGAGGGPDQSFLPDEPVKAQLDRTTEAQQRGEGYSDTDQRILVLAHGVSAPTTDDEISVRDQRWKIASVTMDAAGSYYDLRGRLSHLEAS